MTLTNTLRDRIAKRAAYQQTCFELSNLPRRLAIEDLGIIPEDAKIIARRAVYGLAQPPNRTTKLLETWLKMN